MPSTSIRLKPGVDTNRTPALNEAGISASQMIRFREGLVEKRGGWSTLLANAAQAAIRALWAYQDQFLTKYVAVGSDNGLAVVANGVATDIAPRVARTSPPNAFSTTSGSNLVTITDAGYTASANDIVNISTPTSIGGFCIIGAYPIYAVLSTTQYQIAMGPVATATVANGGTVPMFTTTGGSASVRVVSPNYAAVVGANYGIGLPTVVGGLTLLGIYTIASVIDANTFTIEATTVATSAGTAAYGGSAVSILNYVCNTPKGFISGGSPVASSNWSLASYGNILMACPGNGGVYTWSAASQFLYAQQIPTAPGCKGIMVADAQQMVIAYGSYGSGYIPNTVSWSDAGNYNTWTASGTNQAGSFTLPTGSGIIGGSVGPQQNLIWTDIDIWSMQYIGYPFVWSFNKIATGCGLISQFAWVRIGTAVLWMSQKRFWIYNGGVVQPLSCPVWDDVFAKIDFANVAKIRGGANSGFGEAMWFFPSVGGNGENDSYVCYNLVEGTWDIGRIARSAWLDQSLLGQPMGGDPAGNLYQHETSPDAAGQPLAASFTTGWFLIDEGEMFSFVDLIRPDIKFPSGVGTVQVSVLTCAYTGDAPTIAGPYPITAATEYINTRCRGRYVALKFASSDLGSFWRIGRTQMRFAPSGRR